MSQGPPSNSGQRGRGQAPSQASTFYTAGGGPRRGYDGRGRGQGRGGSGGGGPYNGSYNVALSEDGPRTKMSSYVTPHDAVQAQPAQHGASIVRSGSSPTEGGSILFFSSVQRKGGAFTASERETYTQLRLSRAIPQTSRSTRGGGNVVGSGVSARTVARQYEELEKGRAAQALGEVRRAVARSKRSRFAVESDGEDEEDSLDYEEEGEEDEEKSEVARDGENTEDADGMPKSKKPRVVSPASDESSAGE